MMVILKFLIFGALNRSCEEEYFEDDSLSLTWSSQDLSKSIMSRQDENFQRKPESIGDVQRIVEVDAASTDPDMIHWACQDVFKRVKTLDEVWYYKHLLTKRKGRRGMKPHNCK